MNRKIKKLLRNPKLFVKDMYLKHQQQIKKILPASPKEGHYSYTVITAVYNVEKYLDQYFTSLTKQNLSFIKNITLILVDDGSTDSSADIIKKWQNKYPKNIFYLYKDNGGQASARNFGLEHATGDWLTFIDPDDFISTDYFSKVDKTLSAEKDVAILATAIAVYKEDKNTYHYDTTPLTYCFKDGENKLPIDNLKNKIQLSVCTSFFNTKIIKQNNLKFDEKVRPSFEDGRFVTDYLLITDNKHMFFLDGTYYFYRVREDNSSTTNTQWLKKEKYIDVFQYGYLEMFKKYEEKYNKIPENIQRTFLFFAIQYIKMIIQQGNQTISFLSKKEKDQFYHLLKQSFTYIDKKEIMKFHLHGCNFFYKFGILNLFKNDTPNFIMVYIDKLDQKNNLLSFYFYAKSDLDIEYIINDVYTAPSFKKIREYRFINDTFINEYRISISISSGNHIFKMKSELPIKFIYNGKEFQEEINLNLLKANHEFDINDGPWLFIDKENKADDNAEHFYRYISQNYPGREIYFILNKSSPDWDRLQSENFNLLEFKSQEFESKLTKASLLLSSHADRYFMNYFGPKTLDGKAFIFLQHGVIMHDLSNWLNNVTKINLFCTSTISEYQFIGGLDSPYKYSHEVKLTGLARHDSLLAKANQHDQTKNILIMPTWRNNIVGSLKKGSVEREINPNFHETQYFKHWYTLLHSKELKDIIDKFNFKVTFIPHPNIKDYLPLFELPDYIAQPSLKANFSIQDELAKARVMVTDYSSITFDMAFLNRATFYYQFDAKEFFLSHTSTQGYFSYETNGFGPVSFTQNELLAQLFSFLQNDCQIKEPYKSRLIQTYPKYKTSNCANIYQEIINMGNEKIYPIDTKILDNMITLSKEHHKWKLLEKRCKLMLTLNSQGSPIYIPKKLDVYKNYISMSLFQQNKFVELFRYIKNNNFSKGDYWLARINLQISPNIGLKYFLSHVPYETSLLLICLLTCAKINNPLLAKKFKSELSFKSLTEKEQLILDAANSVLSKNRLAAINKIFNSLAQLTDDERKLYKLELLIFQIYFENNQKQNAHEILIDYEKHTRNDPACRLAISILADRNQDYQKVIYQLEQAFTHELINVPEDIKSMYKFALNNITS